jgi:vacuolar protein sorting-associated protein 13A/C
VLFIKYCSILLQALTIEVDEDLLFTIYDLTKIKGISWEDEKQEWASVKVYWKPFLTGPSLSSSVLIAEPDAIPDPRPKDAGQSLYFEVLELQPIRLSASFMRTERVSSDEKYRFHLHLILVANIDDFSLFFTNNRLSIRNPVAVVLNALTMTVGNVNDAPLELNALAIKDIRLTMPVLQERITHHYRQEILRQLYRILGSADFIGNPVGLFNNVASGVTGLFYEPYQVWRRLFCIKWSLIIIFLWYFFLFCWLLKGVVMHGNRELGAGIAKGAASFVKKTVFGFSDSFTKVTSSVGKGLSSATFDSEYQSRRRLAQRRNRPRHVLYGVTSGGEALVNSVGSAMEGVVVSLSCLCWMIKVGLIEEFVAS